MILSPSKFLSRKFLRGLQSSYYLSESGLEYCPFEVDYLLAEKETRIALVEYNEQLHRLAEQHENSGIDKGSSESLSSNDAPILICADTTLVLKELQNQCQDGTTLETPAPIDSIESIGQKTHQAGRDNCPALRLEQPVKAQKKRYNEREISRAEWEKELEKIRQWHKSNPNASK